MPPTRLALSTAALCALVLLPFAARLATRDRVTEAPQPDRAEATRLLARSETAAAYRALRDLESAGDGDHHLDLQLAVCERHLAHDDRAYERLTRLQGRTPRLEDYRRLWMARSLDRLGDAAAAEAAYEDLLAACQTPAAADSARLYLAELYRRQGQYDRALKLYRQQLRTSPHDAPELLFRMVRAYDTAGDASRAHRTRIQLMEEHPVHRLALDALRGPDRPASAREAFARAVVLYRHYDYRQAVKAFAEVVEKWPRDERRAEAHYMLGRAYQRFGQYARARRTYEKVYERYDSPAALYRIGGLQVRANRDGQAIDTYTRLARAHPGHSLADDALWQAAKAAERHSEFARAQALYEQLARTYPRREYAGEASWSVGFMQYCRGQYEEALATFAEVSGNDAEPHIVDQSLYWAGKSAAELKRENQARRYFEAAAGGFPRSYYSSRAVSLGYAPGGSAEASRVSAQQRVASPLRLASGRRPPLHGEEHLERGDLLARLGLPGLAEAELVRAERLNRGDTRALRLIRDHFEAAGILDRALALSTRLYASEGNTGEIGHLYPSYYWEQVKAAAREARVDPYLVLSVIRQESYFNEDAVSRAGAIGLMQIMPQTGRRLARSLGVRSFERRLLFDPQLSIRMGTRFLGDQVRSFMVGPTRDVGYELGLAAYNAGPRVARQWVERFPYTDPDAFVERIPYKETRLYVKKVLKNYTIYRTLSDA